MRTGVASMASSLPTKRSLKNGYEKETTTMKSQNSKILDHLQKIGSISWVEASDLYRVRSLPRRIADLRAAGHDIVSEWRKDVLGQKYVRYSLAD